MAANYAVIIRQLTVKLERQQLAVESTKQHIEAIRALEASDNAKATATGTKK